MIEMNGNNNENFRINNGNHYVEEIIEVSAKSKDNRSKSQLSNKKRNSMSELTSNRNSQSQINQEKAKPVHPTILKMRNAIDSAVYQIIMTTLTVYILFADDIKTLSTDKTADNPFSIVVVILMFIFFVELIVSAVVMEDYFLNFYFWLDFVSLISMLLDVHWFFDWLIDTISSGGKQAKTIGAIAKAGKSAKIAARAIRILRILRIIRLVRISKLYKAKEKIIKIDLKKKKEQMKKQAEEHQRQQAQLAEANHQNVENVDAPYALGEDNNNVNGENNNQYKVDEASASKQKNGMIVTYGQTNGIISSNGSPSKIPRPAKEKNYESMNSVSMSRTEDISEKMPEESKIGKLLSDRTTKRVIILVLSIMIGIILFNASFYYDKKTGMEYGLKIFPSFKSFNDPNLNLTFSIYIKENIDTDSPVIYAKVGYLQYGSKSNADYLRNSEQNKYSEDCSNLLPFDQNNSICEAIFDIRNGNKLSAILSIVKTFFICFVLSFGAYCFSKDTTEMVLEPIEAMIEKVKQISKNPIEALQKNEKDEITKALMEEEERSNAMCGCGAPQPNARVQKKEVPLETEVLQSTITKIGALLALSFGDAGSEIIAKNMQKNSSGEVNPMISGKKVCAIYAFCDIRNFTDTTEILQEKVMVFVNEIAEIVHEICTEYCGSANKNIGDAFLLVWKFEEKFTYTNKVTKELSVYNCEQTNQLCDMALISIICILAKIYKSKTLDKYRSNEKLNKKFNGYSVRIGFGVHLGWSIEGAIGSTFKIDASYLSPNANMSNALEEKTKEYNALLIMSDKFVQCLSEEAQSRLRMIDIIHGEEEPLGLYTVDIDLALLKIEEEESESQQFFIDDPVKNSVAMRKMAKYQKRMKRKQNYDDAMSFPPKRNFWLDFEESSEDFAVMRENFTDEFYEAYNEGFDEFNFGDWGKAKGFFEQVLQIRKDRPTERFMEIMKKHNFVKPRDWKGNTAE